VAYTSDESGQDEIYLTTFPVLADTTSAWSGNGKELIYAALTDDSFAW